MPCHGIDEAAQGAHCDHGTLPLEQLVHGPNEVLLVGMLVGVFQGRHIVGRKHGDSAISGLIESTDRIVKLPYRTGIAGRRLEQGVIFIGIGRASRGSLSAVTAFGTHASPHIFSRDGSLLMASASQPRRSVMKKDAPAPDCFSVVAQV